MTMRRYKISAHSWNIFHTREEKFCISKWPCNVLFIILTPNEIPNHCKRRDSYVTIAVVVFSRVKISCFRAKAHLVFHWYIIMNIL